MTTPEPSLASLRRVALRALAERVGVSFQTLARIESGQYPASASLLARYAREVGASPSEVRRRYWEARLAWLRKLCREAERMASWDAGGRPPGG